MRKIWFCLFTTFLVIAAWGIAPGNVKAFQEKVFGSWSLICTEGCALSQVTTTDPKGTKVLMGVSVYFPPKATVATIDFRMSPSAKQKVGIGLKVDNFPDFRLPFSRCDDRVCLASGFLDEPLLSQFKSGTFAKVAFVLGDSKQMILPLSLAEFSTAFSELKEASGWGASSDDHPIDIP